MFSASTLMLIVVTLVMLYIGVCGAVALFHPDERRVAVALAVMDQLMGLIPWRRRGVRGRDMEADEGGNSAP
ncbi:hypothetical protein [Nocardia sp. NPDC057440]|uniref:hypothetical protein n=1 Tax=Nocardia sp. NPDC057440 TaxID=3346134 RepID=UPI0036727B69